MTKEEHWNTLLLNERKSRLLVRMASTPKERHNLEERHKLAKKTLSVFAAVFGKPAVKGSEEIREERKVGRWI